MVLYCKIKLMKEVISNYIHILIIALGFLGSFIDDESYWETVIIGIISAYEIFVLALNIKLNKFDKFIILWRLLLGIILFYPMFPLSILIPEYYCAIFVSNIFHFQSLIVFEILSLLFWLLFMINVLNVGDFKSKIYLIFYITTVVILILSWSIDTVYVKFGKTLIYLIWIAIFVIELISLMNSKRKFKWVKAKQ